VLDDHGTNMEEGNAWPGPCHRRLHRLHGRRQRILARRYLQLAVAGLARHPQALGVESYYLPSPKMSSFCRYLTARLHISDVLSWLMSRNPVLVDRDGEVERWTLRGGSCSYPLGANGFVFRRADLESVRTRNIFRTRTSP